MAAMRSMSDRLARAAWEALKTALRLSPARRSVFHAEYASAPTSGIITSVKAVSSKPRKERGYGSVAAAARPAELMAALNPSSIVQSFHDLRPRPMSRVHDSVFFPPSSGSDSVVLDAEDAVRADHRAMRRHVARYHRVRSHGGAAADAHRAEHLRARADEDVIFNHCKIAAVFPRNDGVLSAYGHLVHDRNATADAHAPRHDDATRKRHEEGRSDAAVEPRIQHYAGEAADKRHLQEVRGQGIRAHHRVGVAPLDAHLEPAQDRALGERDHPRHRL